MYLSPGSAREQFTREDLAFVAGVLGGDADNRVALFQALARGENRDCLDDPRLPMVLWQDRDLSRISTRFFFYVMLREPLRQAGLADASLVDYLAEMLARFIDGDQWRTAPDRSRSRIDYEIDLQEALGRARGQERFALHAFGGDRNLFMTGLHAPAIRRRRHRRGAPGVRFYEASGRAHYRSARDHPLAGEFALRDTFDQLAETFPAIRQQLNYVSDEFFN
ncbi:MAG: hypothetical protein ACFE0O_00860 [Opitutales bacterium]